MLFSLLVSSMAAGTPAIKEPVQDGDFCNKLKVTGTGSFEVGVSVKDREIGLEYVNYMQGDGDLEMDTATAEAQKAARIPGATGKGNDSAVPLNLVEGNRLTYSGKTPLVGFKHIKSDAFWGGIGAEITESFSVTQMDREENTYFASTNPASYITDPKKIAELLSTSPVHAVGTSTKNAFNGTWTVDSRMHKFMSKDIKSHQSFTGTFEVNNQVKFHDNPVPEPRDVGCEGIDC
ncbi:MAG: hypothetical protein ACE14P_01420 [Methanotrichaceae archaeon]